MEDSIAERIPELILPNDDTLLDKMASEDNDLSDDGFVRSNERTLLVVGGRRAGKTSLIVSVFQLNEDITPTSALEYFFSQQMNEYETNVCNIWELGGGTNFSPTLYAIEDMPNMTAVVMLDLSAPSTLYSSAVSSIKIINDFAEKRLNSEKIKGLAIERIPDSHPDKKFITPCPTPLVIIGGKYDKFQKFEPEVKRVICSFLRLISHIHFAHLAFFSHHNNQMIKSIRDLLNQFAFGNDSKGKVQLDHNSPLYVVPGEDSFQSIGEDGPPYKIDKYEKMLINFNLSEVETNDKRLKENPKNDPNFREPTIDTLRAEKDEGLERLCQEIELEMKLMEASGVL